MSLETPFDLLGLFEGRGIAERWNPQTGEGPNRVTLYRRAIRTSMGTVFALPWTRLQAWPADLALLREAGFTVAALSPANPAPITTTGGHFFVTAVTATL